MDARSNKITKKVRERCTSEQLDMNLELVIEMLIKGMSRTDIIRHFDKISVRQVDNYISKSREIIKEKFEGEKDKTLPMIFSRLENLYKKNYAIQDYRECRNVIDSTSKLLGLNEPVKKDINNTHTLNDFDIKEAFKFKK